MKAWVPFLLTRAVWTYDPRAQGTINAAVLAAAPKVELHSHGDGSLTAATLWQIGQVRGMSFPADVKKPEDLTRHIAAPHSKSLADFLATFNFFYPFLQDSEEAIEIFSEAFSRQQAAANVIYSEMRFAPQLLITGNVSGVTNEGLVLAAQRGLSKGGARVRILLCCYRNLDPAACAEIVDLAARHRDIVAGIDLAGDETHFPNAPWIPYFQNASALGIPRTIHSGEEGPYAQKNCADAIGPMKANRIGHGYHCLSNSTIVDQIRNANIHLEACPSSSVGTKAVTVPLGPKHPIAHFLETNLSFGLNTDDPGVLLTNMTHELELGNQYLGFNFGVLRQATLNAAAAAFVSDEVERDQLVAKIHDWWDEQPAIVLV
eukprot:gnl/MRDRNA2_/MRDRNA2_72858_c0_seq1.p1 gnl/MRDRNA2_/MRDRNA2_72858_c0~~gnl/MRDRNA2_/MRDRNA2_72858_c0_seq1.p1  ORF type:complete len:375 (-),score=73.72 gnl/MRDRNA2_/MRDRNA2_72858_c0_seq1:465-1589(-)